MWKVHLPATSYLLKQTQFFGTNHFLQALHPTLKKSAGLTFMGRGIQEEHGWSPTDAGINPDPNQPDHPPWNHDPKTGELLEGGQHPIDFVHSKLQETYMMNPQEAAEVLQRAIDRYNSRQTGDKHMLPSFDSPE